MRDDDVDAAIALVGPPFTRALAGSARVRAGARARMTRAGGGVAPGSHWRDDGVSWTPETALLAWSAAALGERAEAEELMAWLESHRTAAGALAEKVLADGRPAGPRPWPGRARSCCWRSASSPTDRLGVAGRAARIHRAIRFAVGGSRAHGAAGVLHSGTESASIAVSTRSLRVTIDPAGT
ncbi:glycoside hydrolase [Actinomyces denticolens]|uniref:hypothetical protein n=1 Tax=Actinomyces denticolens TaxID=52767 RepID=UPI0009D18110|nr:hypothetical protein [Actinomyces denticolens]GAV95402.1 glycoside hydrolase [Actinomyces denticolens]